MAEKVMVFNILKSLKNHIKMIAGITFTSMILIWALLTFLLASQYEATSQILVDQPSGNVPEASQVETVTDPQVMNAYIGMIKSREVLAAAITATGSEMTPAELFEKVSVTNVAASQVLNITVKDKNRILAGEIANSLADAAIAEAWALMKVDNLTIIVRASTEEVPPLTDGNLAYVLTIGGLFGTIVGVLVASIIELFNMLFRTGLLERRRKQSNLQTVFK